jgi:hypothetical protein
MSCNQIRYHVALPAALLIIAVAAGPALARPDSGNLSGHNQIVGWAYGKIPVSPADVRGWDDAHPAAGSAAPLPGDVRGWDDAHPAAGSAAPLPGHLRVWEPGQPGGM